MTIEQIRKDVKVLHYYITQTGVYITYWKWNKETDHWDEKTYSKNTDDAVDELISAGVFEETDKNMLSDYFKGLDTMATPTLSQWDALHLVIRHEYAKSIEQDTSMLIIDHAVEALKKR